MNQDNLDENQYIVRGPPLKWDPPRVNISKYLFDCLQEHKSRVLQIDAVTKEQHTFEDFKKYSVRAALEMRSRGVQKGDFISICASNHMNSTIPFIGGLYLAAVLSPIHTIFSQNDAKRILSKSKSKIIFCDSAYETRIRNALEELNLLNSTEIVVFERDFEPFLAPHEGEDTFEVVDVDDVEKDIAVLVCTSGSSGPIKAVPMTHRTYLVSIGYVRGTPEADPNGTLLFYTSISWTSCFKLLAQIIMIGAKRIVANFKLDKHLQIMTEFKVTTFFSTPGVIVQMIRHPDFSKYHNEIAKNLRTLIYGGTPVTLEQIRLFRSTFKNTVCVNGYGSTEMCTTHGFFELPDPKNEEKEFSCGILFYEFQGKVIDPISGKLLRRNQIGELVFKSPWMMSGYYQDSAQTAEVIDKDGWFHTGDLGYFDDDGYMYIMDRIKDVFKYKLIHINPTEIENVIMAHPAVQSCSVVGKKHDIDVSHPTAFVVKRPNNNVTEQEIVEFTKDKLTDAQQLRGGVRFIDRLPLTSTGKVKRNELRKILESEDSK